MGMGIMGIPGWKLACGVPTTDIYTVDTVLPIHIVWHDEATAKSTTKYGRQQFTSVSYTHLTLPTIYSV